MGGVAAVQATLVEHVDHRLCPGKVSGAQQHDGPVAGPLEHRHLAELGDVVHAGIGTGIRGEDHPGVEQYADTVGHASYSLITEPSMRQPWKLWWRCWGGFCLIAGPAA